ncbi:MAG: hypothetical protein ACPG44_08705 [Polaribacter sp.]
MSTIELKNIITKSLESNDSNLLERIVEVIENYKKGEDNFDSLLSSSQKKELDKIRERHISGESASYSWQEIKQELIDKYGLQA